jgi:hypothetical protein
MCVASKCKGLNCQSSALVKAHIIPAGFGRLIRGDGPNMSLSLEEAREASPQLGEYDSEILCEKCDNRLGVFDDYAIDYCRNFASKHHPINDDEFELLDFDCEKFEKFVLSVLWRASVCKRRKFERVALGPYENRFRDILFGAQPLRRLRSFELMLHRYTSEHLDVTGIYTLPVRTAIFGLNAYIFGLTGFRVIAKLDARPLRREYSQYVLGKSDNVRGIFVEYESTTEFDVVKNIAVKELFRRSQSTT